MIKCHLTPTSPSLLSHPSADASYPPSMQGEGGVCPHPPPLPGVFLVGDQQTHHYIEEFIELVMNARMGFAINHTSILPWVDELLQNTAITCALLTSQG